MLVVDVDVVAVDVEAVASFRHRREVDLYLETSLCRIREEIAAKLPDRSNRREQPFRDSK